MSLNLLDRRIIASLRDKSLRRPGSGPRIAVVANCQSFGIAYAMKLLNVDATVHRFPVVFKSWFGVKTITCSSSPLGLVTCAAGRRNRFFSN